MNPQVPSVQPASVPAEAFLLDVREPDEWAAGHPPDAVHIPMGQIPSRAAEVPQDRDVVVLCRAGGRSAQVAAWLGAQGWRTLNLDGGMQAWAAAGRPMVSENGGDPYVA